MTDDNKKKPGMPQAPSDDEQPEIYGVKKGKNGRTLNRRSFLGAIAASGIVAACGGCAATSQYRRMGPASSGNILTVPCGTPIPPGATCVCDCVSSTKTYHTSKTVCTCDTITIPSSQATAQDVCVCNTIATCTCVGNVSQESHYWRPN